MAPRARLAIYKACWGDAGPLGYQSLNNTDGGCYTSDSVAAIDQAVIDGVDVLNFSITGSRESSLYPVYISFLYAAEAGVFVAASAGNSGSAGSV
ncbi:MAG: S8 family serine peptidase, partial [Luminiphilus sp.]